MNNFRYVIAVFSVRTSTMQFNSVLQKNGVRSLIIETPKSAGVSCGISVRFGLEDLSKARDLLQKSKVQNFVRFYLVENFYGKTQLSSI